MNEGREGERKRDNRKREKEIEKEITKRDKERTPYVSFTCVSGTWSYVFDGVRLSFPVKQV